MAWSPLETPIDYAVLGGQQTPGLCDVQGLALQYRIDKQQGFATTGSYPRWLGRDLAEFKLVIRLYTQQDWDDWETFKPLVLRPPKDRWLTIQHPFTSALGIVGVMVKSVSQPEEIDGGAHAITVELIEFRRPRQTYSKPDAADDKPPEDWADEKVHWALDQVNELAK